LKNANFQKVFFLGGTNPRNNDRGMRLQWLVSPLTAGIESLDPIKVWALQGSGSNQKWHSISQSLATAMLRNHHNIPIGPQ